MTLVILLSASYQRTGYFFTAALKYRLLFPCKEKSSKKGAVKIEENQKLYKHMAWFVVSLFVVILFGELPPFNMIDGAFLKYFGIPVAFTWFVSQKTFDGKKPFGFLKSAVTFALRPKVAYAGKAIKLKKERFNPVITTVRSVMYVPD